MKLKLKSEYLNKKVIIKDNKFDGQINNESEYHWFFNNGFAHLFDVEEEKDDVIQKITKAEVKSKPKAKRYKGIENKDNE